MKTEIYIHTCTCAARRTGDLAYISVYPFPSEVTHALRSNVHPSTSRSLQDPLSEYMRPRYHPLYTPQL